MTILDLIIKKRDGQSLSEEEIRYLINEYNEGRLPDYQMGVLLMAIYFRGLSAKETNALTLALAESGEMLNFDSLPKLVLDKHSSGGVGDTTTLVLAPLVAAAGGPVAKISGRGLGFTGGTIDKLESIPGFHVHLPVERFMELVKENNLAIMAQTESLTPAEGKLYALRDVTGTVENISLIAASIMSKKIAAGAHAILLDVKTGRGAFMQSREEAFELAEILVRIGKDMDRRIVSVVTDMNQPLGYAVGNALEVNEAVSVLKGEGPGDIEELSLILGGYMLALGGTARNTEEGREKVTRLLHNGSALQKFREMVRCQGGDDGFIDDPSLLPQAAYSEELIASKGGYIREIDAKRIGNISVMLGAGRTVKNEELDLAAGIILHRKVGGEIQQGEPLATVYGNDREKVGVAARALDSAFTMGKEKLEEMPPLIYGVVPPFPS